MWRDKVIQLDGGEIHPPGGCSRCGVAHGLGIRNKDWDEDAVVNSPPVRGKHLLQKHCRADPSAGRANGVKHAGAALHVGHGGEHGLQPALHERSREGGSHGGWGR